MTSRWLPDRRQWLWPVELALVSVLAASWTVAYLAARQSLDEVPPGTSRFFLALYDTDARLEVALALGLLGVAVLVSRHRFPTGSFLVVSVLLFVIELRYAYVTRVQFATGIMLVVSVFWALWRTHRFRLLLVVALAVGAAVTIPAYAVNRNLSTASTIEASAPPLVELTSIVGTLQSVVLVAVAAGAAALVRRYDAQAAELAERNRELTEQRATAARAAVLDERVRIARELHDVVAHHVTTMTVHAGAARQIVAVDPATVTDALHQIEESGRGAVVELQRILGFLRSGGDDGSDASDRAPVPSLRHLDGLGASLGAGFECDIELDGDLSLVPQSVDVSAYRIVQEALTNVMKHSAAERVEVQVVAGLDDVELTVIDDGTATNGEWVPGVGHGLVGIRERATLHGGSVTAGPVPGRGWRVHARLRYERDVSTP
ncbi:MAG: histidine kinase [Actinomycetota bacterium]